MSLQTADFISPTYNSARLAHGVPVSSKRREVPMEVRKFLTSLDFWALAESQMMASGAPTILANILMALGTSDSDFIGMTQT